MLHLRRELIFSVWKIVSLILYRWNEDLVDGLGVSLLFIVFAFKSEKGLILTSKSRLGIP